MNCIIWIKSATTTCSADRVGLLNWQVTAGKEEKNEASDKNIHWGFKNETAGALIFFFPHFYERRHHKV